MNATRATSAKKAAKGDAAAPKSAQDIRRDKKREQAHMKLVSRTVFKKSPVPVGAVAESTSSKKSASIASTALASDAAIDVEHHDDIAFADIDDAENAGEFVSTAEDDDDDYRMLTPNVTTDALDEADEREERELAEEAAAEAAAAATTADTAATGAPAAVDTTPPVDDNVVKLPIKRPHRTLQTASQVLRMFDAKVKEKRVNFMLVLSTLQKLSIHDRPRSMMRVIRVADNLGGSLTPRQRMRMRYTLIAHHIMHHRYDKALAMLKVADDLTMLDASLSAVIVLLETRHTAEADTFAAQIDSLLRAANCRFSQESLNSLMLIYSKNNNVADADSAYTRLRNDSLVLEADAVTAYMRLIAPSAPENTLTVGYRARRDGIPINSVMYTSMIRACLDLNQLPRAVALFDTGIREGIRHTSATYAWLLDAFASLRDDARVDEFLAWSKAQNVPMSDAARDTVIRHALNRNDVDGAQQLMEAAIDAGLVVDGARFLELAMRLLAVDQRRRAQQFLRAVAPKLANRQVLFMAVKAVASAFGREWNEAVDWLHEMRDLGVDVPAQLFAIAAAPLKNDVEGSRAFVAQMREQKVPVVHAHYGVALRNCAHDVDATVALFRQMLEVDGIFPDTTALAALVAAYVSSGRRSEALRAIRSTVQLVPDSHFEDRIFEPFLSAAPLGDEAERVEWKLDASGKPALERIVQLTGERQALHATFSFQLHLGMLAAEQRQINFIRTQVGNVEHNYTDPLSYHDKLMQVLLTASAHDERDTPRLAAELAMQLFERAHKLALLRPAPRTELMTVRRVTAFRDNCFNVVPRALEPIHVGPLGDAVQAIMQRPVAQARNIALSKRMWNNAMRACEVAGLDVQRAALEADWKLVAATMATTQRHSEPAEAESS